jgi:hypothetical protein
VSFRPSSATAIRLWAIAKQQSFAIAMAAAIDGNGLQAEGTDMRLVGDTGLTQDRRCQ